jgi:hypothetical protein
VPTLKPALLLLLLLASCGGGSGSGGAGGMAGSGGAGGSPPTCGFAACPQGLTCQDDPRDNCDPTRGGADCPGRCFSCVQAPTCTNGGVSCGDHCCNPGEWCDTVFQAAPTCQCGNHAACTGGDHCASPGPIGQNDCGIICCGVSMACPR